MRACPPFRPDLAIPRATLPERPISKGRAHDPPPDPNPHGNDPHRRHGQPRPPIARVATLAVINLFAGHPADDLSPLFGPGGALADRLMAQAVAAWPNAPARRKRRDHRLIPVPYPGHGPRHPQPAPTWPARPVATRPDEGPAWGLRKGASGSRLTARNPKPTRKTSKNHKTPA